MILLQADSSQCPPAQTLGTRALFKLLCDASASSSINSRDFNHSEHVVASFLPLIPRRFPLRFVCVVATASCFGPTQNLISLLRTFDCCNCAHKGGGGVPDIRDYTSANLLETQHGPDRTAFLHTFSCRFPAVRDGGERGGRGGSPGAVPRSRRFHSAG